MSSVPGTDTVQTAPFAVPTVQTAGAAPSADLRAAAFHDSVFEFVHCRNSVVALVAIFEAAVSKFNSTLSTLGHAPARDKYKQLLLWICELLETTKVGGSAAMLARLRQTCGDLDHARRLRNCITHNNGSYEQFYFDDTINGWVTPQHMEDAVRGVAAKEKIFIVNAVFQKLLRSHIEVLHILHNTLQRTFFGGISPEGRFSLFSNVVTYMPTTAPLLRIRCHSIGFRSTS